jgi:Fe-S-cluster-containing dehydrogenase component
MGKWNMVIDVAKCEDCNNCFLACKDEHVDNNWIGYTLSQPLHGHRWINIMRKERGAYPMIDVAYCPTPCMHCDDAPCIKEASDNEVYKRDDGIVIIDPEKAKGHKELVKACPYGAIFWNEDKNSPQKCTFCAHLLDEGWKKPRCVQSCPTDALEVIYTEDDEMAARVKDEGLEVLLPEKNTRPRIYYRNLYRFQKCFIGGSVSFKKDGISECAEGSKVTLIKGAETINTVTSDSYGDFKFDNLRDENSVYNILITFQGREKTLNVELKKSIYLGDINISGR